MEAITFIFAGLSVFVSTIAIFMTLKIISLRQKNKLLIISLARVQDIFNDTKQNDQYNDVHKENFIKFLSDSRDWAYEYIQEVQSAIQNFISEVEPEITYFDEYGLVGDAYPHYHSMKKISTAYKELKALLPEDESN